MGTPLYMSPEQCRDSAKIDFRTDIYSLGCVLFEMLTGRPPFTHELMGDLVVAHMTETPQSVRAVNPAVPAALSELVADLLRKDPAQRPADMRAVADRLSAVLAAITTLRAPGGPVAQVDGGASAANDGATREAARVRTTFGGTASELVPPAGERGRGQRRIAIAVVTGCAVVAVAAAGILATRGRGSHTAGAPPPAAAPTPAAAALPSNPVAAPPSLFPPSTQPPALAPPPHEPLAAHARKHPALKAAEPNEPASAIATPPARAEPPPPPPPAAPPSPPPAAVAEMRKGDLGGSWEGPWNDADHQQKGRLYVQVGGDGAAAGWMFNSGAGHSYRMTGRMGSDGLLDLVCDCHAEPSFTARGLLIGNSRGELHGRLMLSTAAGAFGQTQVTLSRAAPR
jgi:serine/threonine-protein kinase